MYVLKYFNFFLATGDFIAGIKINTIYNKVKIHAVTTPRSPAKTKYGL